MLSRDWQYNHTVPCQVNMFWWQQIPSQLQSRVVSWQQWWWVEHLPSQKDYQKLTHKFPQSGRHCLLQCRILEDWVLWPQADHIGPKKSEHYLRNRKHFPCFYRVIETRVEVWENEKCCGNTSCRQVFPQLFRVLPNLHECFYNLIETWRKCFLFLSENSPRKITKNEENLIVLFIIKM